MIPVKWRGPLVEDCAFRGGYPTANTVQRACDEAALNRAIMAYPTVSIMGTWKAF